MLGIKVATTTSCKQSGVKFNYLGLLKSASSMTRLSSIEDGSSCICPPAFVHTTWLEVQQEAPQITQVDDLVDYFDSTWINGQFQPYQWNYFNYGGPHKDWHSRLKKVVGKPDITGYKHCGCQ